MQEEKIFKRYTWNGEPDTIRVAILVNGNASQVETMVERYLDDLGFKQEENSILKPTGKGKRISYGGWLIDMSAKKFKRVMEWSLQVEERNLGISIPLAWPSQLAPYMQGHRGTLVGHRFGI